VGFKTRVSNVPRELNQVAITAAIGIAIRGSKHLLSNDAVRRVADD